MLKIFWKYQETLIRSTSFWGTNLR